MISPLWQGLGAHPGSSRAEVVVGRVGALLPFETSQRFIPASGEAVSRLLVVRPTNDGIEPGSREAQFVLRGGRRGELMVAAAAPLAPASFKKYPSLRCKREPISLFSIKNSIRLRFAPSPIKSI